MNILEFAINMEKSGENFYRRQAKENSGNALFKVFSILADDEKQHAQILLDFSKHKTMELSDSELENSRTVFNEEFQNDIKQKPIQLDIYREALKKEQESIDLYKELAQKSDKSSEVELFNYLIKQEELHHKIITDLIFHLEKPESWVESAEFGTREDY